MKKRLLVLAAALLAFPAGAAAAERPVPWELVGDLPDAKAETVRIRFGVDACGTNQDVQRVKVERRDGSITVTALDEEPDAEVCPAVIKYVERTVDLRGTLGGRSIVDTATDEAVVPAETPLADWVAATTVKPRLRRLTIAVPIGCKSSQISRTLVERARRSVTITVMVRKRKPCGTTQTLPVISVSLHGRLGRRVIRDGGFSPPQVVYRPASS